MYSHLYPRLCKVYDEIFNHCIDFDFSFVKKLDVDTITFESGVLGCCYGDETGSTIIIAPGAFTLKVANSPYSSHIETDRPLHYILAHEIGHMLVNTRQIPCSELGGEAEEVACDEFAIKLMKEIK
ncbi:hypothetical protein ACLHDG_09055 [Sulfurovum sp. CS9]|uniref:hypothetical protein n=1 Tax=Sulfurovum sp. CS9 TaxID=3391146 RepID=UPI0039EBD94A